MRKNAVKLYKIILSTLSLLILSSCTTKNEPRLLVYKINNEYFPLEKTCVEQVSLREDKSLFYKNDNLIIELDNKKECVKQFSTFINSNIGEKMQTLFNGYQIYPETKIVSALFFVNGLYYQAVANRAVALAIVNEYAN
ncbi:Uncharacterised protein [Yersinia bercovieri]|uniref:hypothetical protein n=2 Tax=Yersinia bercovieri TaxID=634 RepID=UPI00061C5FC8|nr:hypothetical protein [Yersinia bercovieri]MCB5300862.1 hypothetical protein [Yersinia bercovieri]CNE39065.1 Uncharacterised protein [Yersinia bercovieri]